MELYLYLPIEFAGEGVLSPADAERFRGHANRAMAFIDRVLAEREFIAGHGYTIADTFALSALDFGIRHTNFEIKSELKNLTRWHEAVSSRPSASA